MSDRIILLTSEKYFLSTGFNIRCIILLTLAYCIIKSYACYNLFLSNDNNNNNNAYFTLQNQHAAIQCIKLILVIYVLQQIVRQNLHSLLLQFTFNLCMDIHNYNQMKMYCHLLLMTGFWKSIKLRLQLSRSASGVGIRLESQGSLMRLLAGTYIFISNFSLFTLTYSSAESLQTKSSILIHSLWLLF